MYKICLYLDDVQPIDSDFIRDYSPVMVRCRSVNELKDWTSRELENKNNSIMFDLDHDLGDYSNDGGNTLNFINWLIENFNDVNNDFAFHFHSNHMSVDVMRNTIKKYWTEI